MADRNNTLIAVVFRDITYVTSVPVDNNDAFTLDVSK